MFHRIEEKLLKYLQWRQNRYRFDTPEVSYQDCIDLMFVLAKRLERIEKKLIAKSTTINIKTLDAKSFEKERYA